MEDLILLVEDDETFGQAQKNYFEDNGLSVIWAKNGRKAISLFQESHPRLILLDDQLPDIDGIEVAAKIRKSNSIVPIIFLTGEAKDVVCYNKAFWALRAVNYIEKPINLNKLLAQIRGLLQPVNGLKYEKEGYQITIYGQLLTINDRGFKFTEREIQVLSIMLENFNSPVSRKDILLKVWDNDEFKTNNVLNSTIKRIKSKLKDFSIVRLETIYGIGYRLFLLEDK